jgi:hypothetical protein
MIIAPQNAPRVYFEPLQQDAFQRLEHAASLKGLLKAFKGKGNLEEWASQCQETRNQLIGLSQHGVLSQTDAYPFALLPIRLAQQTTGSGTAFLRWRKADRSAMGVHLWDELLLNAGTPAHLLADLYAIEMQRITLNMQVSLLHGMARQAGECAVKMAHAQSIYQRRMQSGF